MKSPPATGQHNNPTNNNNNNKKKEEQKITNKQTKQQPARWYKSHYSVQFQWSLFEYKENKEKIKKKKKEIMQQ